jgi:type IV secretory pathway TrbD component
MTDFWLPHLAFTLLVFLILARLARTALQRGILLSGCLLLSLLPLQGISLALQLRTYIGDLSVASLVLLGWATLSRFGLPPVGSRDRLASLALFAGLAVLLYPAALGMSYADPYLLGFEPRSMLLVLGLLCAVLIIQRSWLGALALVLATLAFALRLGASENYWDYLIDPYLALYSLGALLSAAVRWLLARPTRNLV